MKKIACSIVLDLTLACCWAAAQQPTTSANASGTNASYVQGVGPGYTPGAGSALMLSLTAGTAFCGNAIQNYAGGTVSLTASATNYVYLNTASSCAPAANTTGFTAASIPIATVVTSASAITTVTDVRTWFVAPSSGIAGGNCAPSNFVTAIGSSTPMCAQPGFADLSGTAAIAQLPLSSATNPGILQLGGDLSGSAAAPAVVKLQGRPVSSTAPSSYQFLGWNGMQWVGARVAFSQLNGVATAAQLPAATAVAPGAVQLSGDLGGTGTAPRVTGLQGYALASTAPTANQVLTWNGTAWAPAIPATGVGLGSCPSGQYVIATTSSAPTCAQPAFTGLAGTATSAQLPAATSSGQGAVQLAQDLTGTAAAPTVAGLQGNPVSVTAPTANQVLTWSGTAWAPATPVAGAGLGSCPTNQYMTTTTSAAPACAQPAFTDLTGSASSAQLPAATSSAQGAVQLSRDLTGSATAPTVAGLQGNPVSATAPTANQVLTWSGTAWAPATPAAPAAATPAGSSTQLEFNNAGAFGGTSNLTYASTTGAVTLNQLANGNETLYGTRSTDTSPTGNLIHFQNYAKTADLFKADTSGNVTATSFTSTASGPFVMSGTEGACSGAAAGKDVLCLGDTSTHTAQLALNGGAFVPIPQLAGDLGGTAAAPQVVSTHLGHLNQAVANGALAGTIALSAATSASQTFGNAFSSAPVCALTPTSNPGSGTLYWVTATATQVTANVNSPMTITFNYHCIGNPN